MIWRALPSYERGYDPLREFDRLQREVNRLFNGVHSQPYEFPEVNVWANEDEAMVRAEVPGVDPADLNLTVTGKTLVLEGKRGATEAGDNEAYHRQERGMGNFVRTVRLPFEIESDQIEARTTNGVLTVRLPRKEETKPRKISIQSE